MKNGNCPLKKNAESETGKLRFQVRISRRYLILIGALASFGIPASAMAADAYWRGTINNVWSTFTNGTSNWTSNSAGTMIIGAVPATPSDVIFSATGSSKKNTVLGANIQIRSLSVIDPEAVTIGGINTLMITSPSDVPAIAIASGAGPATISCNLMLSGSSPAVVVNTGAALSVSGTIGGAIGLTKAGYGSMLLSAHNDFAGNTTVSAGQLITGIDHAIPDQSRVSVYGGALLNLDGFDQSIGSLADHGIVMLGAATLTTGNNNTSTTFTGTIAGSGNVIKTGTGLWNITGNHLYTGSTEVRQGGLLIGDGMTANASINSSSTVFVAPGAALGVMLAHGETFSNAVVNSGVVVANAPGVNTLAGVISGAGHLIQFGSGTTVLAAQNSYTGETVVVHGVLQIGGDSRGGSLSPSSQVLVDAGAILALKQAEGGSFFSNVILNPNGLLESKVSGTILLAGVILGEGGLVQSGSGTTILSGSNAYSGDTVILNGTLRTACDRALWSGSQASVGFVAPGLANISESPVMVSGPESVQRTNIVLDHAGTFDVNGTRQSVGTLKDGPNGGGIVNLGGSAGELEIFVSGIDRFSGSIQGAGSFIKSGGGVWVFTGNVCDAGIAFTIGAGTFETGKENVFSAGCNLTIDPNALLDLKSHNQTIASLSGGGGVNLGSATLTMSGADGMDHVFSGDIQGTGDIVKESKTTWTIEGRNASTGTTTINAGRLIVNGLIAGSALIQNGGILQGSGKIGGNLVNNGTVQPGNSPGKLTIQGNYTQAANGTLAIEIASRNLYDQLVVGGKGNLDGTLSLTWLNGYVPTRGDRFTILSAANGITGKFTNLQSPKFANTMLSLGIAYEPNAVVVETQQAQFASLPGLTPNELALAEAVDPLIYRASVSDLIDVLDSISTDSISSALRRIVPVEYTVVYDAGIATSNIQAENLERRMQEIRNGITGFSTGGLSLRDPNGTLWVAEPKDTRPIGKDGAELAPAPLDPRWGFFINGSGEFVGESRTGNAIRSSFNTGGLTLGADYRVLENAAIGLTAGYTNLNTKWSGEGSLENNGGKVGMYGTVFKDGFFLNGVAGGGFNSYDIRRDTLGGIARGNTDGNDFNALLGTGYTYRSGGWSLGPISSLRYTWVELRDFDETGSLAPLRLKDQSEDSLRSTAGMQLSYAFGFCNVIVAPELRAQWQHEYLYRHGEITASFAEGNSFTVNGPGIGRDSALIDAGITVQFTPEVALYGYYSTELGRSNYTSHNLFGGVQITFF